MDIRRKPFQIVLIEQLFYPFTVVLGITLLIFFVMPAILKMSAFEAEYIVYGFFGFGILGFYSLLYIWLPYTSIRIWFSASQYTKGVLFYIFKAYSGIVFICLVGSALYALYYLPEVFDAVVLHNK